MTSVKVHGDADFAELLNGVDNALLVGGLSVRAVRIAQVGDQVREGIGLNDGNDADTRVGFDLSDDLVDVVFVVGDTIVGDLEFTVGCLGMAITVGKIVDNDLEDGIGGLSSLLQVSSEGLEINCN